MFAPWTRRFFVAFLVTLSPCQLVTLSSVSAQEKPTLRLGGVLPGGVRSSATDSWGTYDFELTNLTAIDRRARVLVRFEARPDVLYGRDVWVPAESEIKSWLLVGPAVLKDAENMCSIEVLLYDRTDGTDRLILPPGERLIRSRPVPHRLREPFTAILLDEEPPEELTFGRLPEPDSRNEEAIRLARTFRLSRRLSEFVQTINARLLPSTPEAYDGIDHFVLASNRIGKDPAGMKTLRHWLERGGKVWVMLDLLNVDVLAPLLGDALDFQVVDRVRLTNFRFDHRSTGQRLGTDMPLQRHDQAIEFARVLLPAGEQTRYTVNGWPAYFTRTVGRGKVVFTTLGPRAWYEERKPNEPPAPFMNYPRSPKPTDPLGDMALELQSTPSQFVKSGRSASPQDAVPVEAFAPMLTEEIGYSVVGRGTVLLIFASFLLGALVVGLTLRNARRPELLGWLGPLGALAASGVFLFLGESSRRAVPPSVAVVQVVDAVSGEEEAAIHGALAVYRPDSGPAEMKAQRGGFFELNMEGLQGQIHRLILTDMDAWHWENVALPAGVRFAPFRTAVPSGEPLSAHARFGPEGLEGKLTSGRFQDLSDALLITASDRNLAVRMRPDGAFEVKSADILPQGQYLREAVLSDQQQHRQDIYRKMLQRSRPEYLQGRNVLLAWCKPTELRFDFVADARTTGSALLIVPLQLERPAPGKRISVPAALIPYQRMLNNMATRPVFTMHEPIDMLLRFQLPRDILPFTVERARLSARLVAPARRVTLAGRDEGKLVELHQVESPLDPIRVDITDPRLLHLDPDGGLYVNVAIGPELNRRRKGPLDPDEKWTIEFVELEVSGRPEG
jgi:hypothetical protein